MRKTMEDLGMVLPLGFLDPLPPKYAASPSPLLLPAVSRPQPANGKGNLNGRVNFGSSKQFWKAGDYEGAPHGDWDASSGPLGFKFGFLFPFGEAFFHILRQMSERLKCIDDYVVDF
ncbi:hypothetical protein Acr_26g0006160 [Actinidia rufa]|uniref:Uncharacterized protein n=1 Tax=Actinidia rufa TaxID=165716 RepID=A0A7J0H2N6_9ERIC|nr:hypothetical protein Acr_26g0006160 [Actinidia rufa]